ncbi:MAG: alkaline phosphatase, partial [Elusimicrobiota bacterium]|nr:alkaline phosphatase [Elusimicrobiota bacterium]
MEKSQNVPRSTFFKERPSLSEMTEVALKILSKDPDGFFLLIEGGRIDHACHDNNLENMLGDMYEFDEAIGVVKNFI